MGCNDKSFYDILCTIAKYRSRVTDNLRVATTFRMDRSESNCWVYVYFTDKNNSAKIGHGI